MSIGWVCRTPVLVKEIRRPEQQASDLDMVTEVGAECEIGLPHSKEECYLESIVTLIGRTQWPLPEDLKESEAIHEDEGYPHTSGTAGDGIGVCFISLPATIYIVRLCMEKWR